MTAASPHPLPGPHAWQPDLCSAKWTEAPETKAQDLWLPQQPWLTIFLSLLIIALRHAGSTLPLHHSGSAAVSRRSVLQAVTWKPELLLLLLLLLVAAVCMC